MKLPLVLLLSLLILPLVTANICYQETANVSTACGGLATGGYSSDGNWHIAAPAHNAWDGSWVFMAYTQTNSSARLYINYTIPDNATELTQWQIRNDGGQWLNFSFSNDNITPCLGTNTLQLRINITFATGTYRQNASCYTGTVWSPYYWEQGANMNAIFEEGMFWDFNSSHWANLTFTGSASGNDYTETVYCTQGGVEVRRSNGLWELPYGNSTYECTGTDNYQAFNHSFWNINGTPQYTETITVTEYSTILNWDTNVTGGVFWGCTPQEHCQEILQDSTRYNPATFTYTYSPSTWDENAFIEFYWNNQSYGANASAQYFDIINEYTSITTEYNLTTLTTLDFNLWLEILNYGEEVLYGSTIRVYYNPNSTYDHTLVGQRITQPVSGDAMQGPLFYLDRTLSYTIVITHPGYQQRTIQLRGYDFDSDLKLQIKLLPNDLTLDYDYTVTGPHLHHNHSTLDYTIGHPNGGTYYYSTSYLTSRTERTFTNGGDTITLALSTHYEPNSNFTLNIWSRNDTTGTYTLETTHDVTYQPWDEKNFTTTISSTNNVLNILLWIAIIAISSIIGVIIKKDGIDTGYYAYNAATFIVAIFNIFFLPIAILNGLVLLGSLVTNVIRD